MMTPVRVLLLVIDGFGVGAMPDALPGDRKSHTLRSILATRPSLAIPNLLRLGLGRVAGIADLPEPAEVVGAYGRASLGYPGADTYLGHQELMGAPMGSVRLHMLADVDERLREALSEAGYHATSAIPGSSALMVDDRVLIADDIEAAPGLNINVTASLDEIGWDELLEMGDLVRSICDVPRIIVVAGRGFDAADMRAAITHRTPDHSGVDTPSLGVYDANYRVRRLGASGTGEGSLPALLADAGLTLELLGKAADVIEGDAAIRERHIPTVELLDAAERHFAAVGPGLLVANVQESDLAGHEQDAERFARVIEDVDRALPRLLALLRPADVLLVAADHGNDPLVGHSQHTREFTPVLAAGPGVAAVPLGHRQTLSDTGATIAEILGLPPTRAGLSFAGEILASQGAAAPVTQRA